MPDGSYQLSYPRLGSVLDEDEIAALARLLLSGNTLSQGGVRAEFERRFAEHIGVRHALSVTSGTVALELAIRLLDLRPGDEVIVTPQTYKATIQPLLNYDVTVRFCDVDPDTLNITAPGIERLINDRTRAVLLVHYGGLPCEMAPIMALARRHDLLVVEDCAHALGALHHGRHPGALADIGCFSFHTSKNITTLGEGGMLTVSDDRLAERIERVRSNEADAVYRESPQPIGEHTAAAPWMMHPGISYTHVCTDIGYAGTNATMAEANAAVGLVQLDKLPDMVERRRAIARRLDEVVAGVDGVRPHAAPPGVRHANHLYTFFVEPDSGIDRNTLVTRLDERGIEMQLRYFPLHLLPEWRRRGHHFGECPETERRWFHHQVNLPCHPRMTDEQVDLLTTGLDEALRQRPRDPARSERPLLSKARG